MSQEDKACLYTNGAYNYRAVFTLYVLEWVAVLQDWFLLCQRYAADCHTTTFEKEVGLLETTPFKEGKSHIRLENQPVSLDDSFAFLTAGFAV